MATRSNRTSTSSATRDTQKATSQGNTRKDTPRDGRSTCDVLRMTRSLFEEITGRKVEAVSAFSKTDHGWELQVEVVELARIPDTTSVMATYEVRLDPDGEFAGYRRLRRYSRGQIDV